MRFLLDAEQRAFAGSLHAMLSAAGTPAVIRAWSRGDPARGRALWSRIAEAGVFGLAVPEDHGGLGRHPVELALAFVELGRHAVPGPLVETVAAAVLVQDLPSAERFLPGLVAGTDLATVATPLGRALRTAPAPAEPAPDTGPPLIALARDPDPARLRLAADTAPARLRLAPGTDPATPHLALDADAATLRLVLTAEGLRLATAAAGPPRRSLDPARRLTPLTPDGELLTPDPPRERALTWARLAIAAQALGVGLALLDRTVAHVRRRTQFGVPIGSFQAVKHRLADARTALEFARPLVLGAAVSPRPADVAAAKLTACEAAYTAARAALQLHGAIGYTAEYDLSLWLTKARALRTAWGTPEECREAVLDDALKGHDAPRRPAGPVDEAGP
ncbi:acyl-CoA dehydrogenase family protein [Streptomyces durhamensis]|uniref:acyl-CoA dehydrogenase family protein n=1 Tax=Streptomyces durhamensis TaxID=68194 RepID=UPI00068EA8A7|nr:acyl-CoA dehydrogenase family protein [Streptomyces durhamensis]